MSLSTFDERTALVVIDLQAGVLAGTTAPLPAADVPARSVELADAFRSHGLPVVLVRVSGAPDGADGVPGRNESGRGRPRPPGWDVLTGVATSIGWIFPRLGETGSTAEVLELLAKTR